MVFKTGTDTTNKETDYWFSGPIGVGLMLEPMML